MSDTSSPLPDLVGRTIVSVGESSLGDRLTLDDGTNLYALVGLHVVAPITGTGHVTLVSTTITDGDQ